MALDDASTDRLSLAKRLLDLLGRVPANDRARFAYNQLLPVYPALVRAFLSIRTDRKQKSLMYLSARCHSRERRLAASARSAGFDVYFVTGNECTFASELHFHAVVADTVHQILASWLFPGLLVHGFALRGDLLSIPARLKPRRWVVDLYDTTAGTYQHDTPEAEAERYVLETADGVVHRDLRIHRLARTESITLPSNQLFLHDPIETKIDALSSWKPGDPFHVVSTGWIGRGANSIIRSVEKLCAAGIHVHLCFTAVQGENHRDLEPYRQLARSTPHLHLHGTLEGEAYWDLLKRCHFGLSLMEPEIFGEPTEGYTRDSMEACGSSRISDYVACRLGVIGNRRLRFQAFWSRRHASSYITADLAFLNDPIPILHQARNAATVRNLKSISTAECGKRLEAFYHRVALNAQKTSIGSQQIAPPDAGGKIPSS